ncbi:VCBS repeat-containing protein [Hasllibacter sp. MH4015]|uniref:FG-GAP repeat domain-containing protein n=1 Tax=Hasllibacter sp. MH4015 TaxID=2854029 RepID=UPI001CD3D3BC|nr:VCBS repeat-containing protein [Hasllibacter sp. MH4015]
MALCLWLTGSGVALACTLPPHAATAMPESVSAPWPGPDGVLAWYDIPTTRYAHGVLGDAIEGTRLHVYSDIALSSCGDQSLTLPPHLVFEDTAPRLADLDGDGVPEIIAVQSHEDFGAQLAIYRRALDGIGLEAVATTPHIGRRNRWLAPIGAADLDGDGHVEIAYIDRPHLARTLRVWRFQDDTLTEIAALEGLTNHRIGEPFITGGIRSCSAGPEMIVADRDWRSVMAVRLEGGTLTARALGPFSADSVARALACTL